jgi:hypothetical protein
VPQPNLKMLLQNISTKIPSVMLNEMLHESEWSSLALTTNAFASILKIYTVVKQKPHISGSQLW